MATRVEARTSMNPLDYDYSSFFYSSSDDPFSILEPYNEWYNQAVPEGYYLFAQAMSTPPSGMVDLTEGLHHEHVKLINLSSYNYLGLSYRREVIEAGKAAIEKYGLGAAGSPILSGTMDIHSQLEDALAKFKKKEAVMVFPTGYSTNVGMISALMRPGDWVIADQNAHASIVDGAILSKANVRFFRHNNPADLEKKLKQTTGKKLVAIEGVYSMDGDVCPLPDLVAVAKKYGARILLDEAHSAFVYGANGRGVAEQFGLEDEVDIHIGTFSKALGGQGGYVGGSQNLYNYLKGFARSRVFSCALSPAVTAGVLKALELATARAGAAHQAVVECRAHACAPRGGGRRCRRFLVADHSDHGPQRSPRLRARSQAAQGRDLSAADHLSRGRQAPVAIQSVGIILTYH
jgi:7-keto-8-aminopelargonate synthetase-like enzyme